MRIVVDLPAPFGPRNPVTRPGRTVRSMPSTAVFAPYFFVRPCAVITSDSAGGRGKQSWLAACRFLTHPGEP